MLQINIGSYSLSMKYLFKRSTRNTYYYRRRVPSDLVAHYPKPFIEISLKQNDKTIAAVLCQEQNRMIENQFQRLRQGLPKEQVLTNYQSAINYLKSFDLTPQDAAIKPGNGEHTRDAFYDSIDDTIRQQTSSEVYAAIQYQEAPFPLHLLNDQERSALAIIQGKFRLTASQYPEEYLRIKGKQADRKANTEATRVISSLIDCCGDRAPSDYTRSDVTNFIKTNCLTKKTTTVQRQLKAIAAMFNLVTLEMDIAADRQHPFTNFKIPSLGNDARDREDFTAQQISTIRNMPLSKTPEITHLIHLMLDTGMRVKECCGLMVTDVKLDAEIPHITLYRNAIRSLKTKNSRRLIPLVGAALDAMCQAVKTAQSDYVFPRYIDELNGIVKNDNASAACKKRLISLLGDGAPTAHSFRHTMQTRLRDTGCPKDVRDELGGWAKDISDKYGTPSDLKLKAKYLLATLSEH